MSKRWSTTFVPGAPRTQHNSKAALYRWAQDQAAQWANGALRYKSVSVWVDERDGRGWQLYERLDLVELHRLHAQDQTDPVT
jgi:hypothetical protein